MKKIVSVLLFFLVCLASYAQKASMHLVMAAATNDAEAGKSCQTDIDNIRNAFKKYASVLKLKYDAHFVSGDNFSKRHLLTVFDSIKVKDDDILVFVYSGHGFRFQDDSDAFPTMKLTYDDIVDENDYLSVSTLYDKIRSKKARLTICLSDCCNTKVDLSRTEFETPMAATRAIQTYNPNSLKTLFLESSGYLKLSSAQPGQEAYGDGMGGYFLSSIVDNINRQVSKSYKKTPSWTSIVADSQKEVKNKADGKEVHGEPVDPQVVVRNVSIEGENTSDAVSADSVSQAEGESDGFVRIMILFVVITASIAIVSGLVYLVFKSRNKK